MLIRDQMKSRSDFTQSETLIAEFFLNNQTIIDKSTVREIADTIYVAPSSIIRFAKKLGFSGYNDLKEKYLEEWDYLTSNFTDVDANKPFNPNDKDVVLANKIGILYKETVDDCLSLLTHDSIQEATSRIVKVHYIYICASAAQIGLASTFKDKMQKIGRHVLISQTSDDAFYQACMAAPGDSCFILISYSGETGRCHRIAQKLRERKMKWITITTYGANSLSEISDCVLNVSTREKLISNLGTFAFNISVMMLLDILYAACFNHNHDANLEYKTEVSREFEQTDSKYGRQSDNPILSEL